MMCYKNGVSEYPPLAALRDQYENEAHPLVIFNKSHSGSRLLAEVVETAGVFMGAHQNESRDSLDILDLVFALVLKYYPDYEKHRDAIVEDVELTKLCDKVFRSHLEGYDRKGRSLWGWKLCETTYVIPIIDYLFPRARFIHLIRDGRDVAFCDHRGPDSPFWRKVYFNTDRFTWKALLYNRFLYRFRSPIYNALHWLNSVETGRTYAAALGGRCLEIRYEDLCLNLEKTVGRLIDFIGAGDRDAIIRRVKPRVHTSSIGKYRSMPLRRQRSVLKIVGPMLEMMGYGDLRDGTFPT